MVGATSKEKSQFPVGGRDQRAWNWEKTLQQSEENSQKPRLLSKEEDRKKGRGTTLYLTPTVHKPAKEDGRRECWNSRLIRAPNRSISQDPKDNPSLVVHGKGKETNHCSNSQPAMEKRRRNSTVVGRSMSPEEKDKTSFRTLVRQAVMKFSIGKPN